jgi:hypothetical protein
MLMLGVTGACSAVAYRIFTLTEGIPQLLQKDCGFEVHSGRGRIKGQGTGFGSVHPLTDILNASRFLNAKRGRCRLGIATARPNGKRAQLGTSRMRFQRRRSSQ